jgi:hypothetical protein
LLAREIISFAEFSLVIIEENELKGDCCFYMAFVGDVDVIFISLAVPKSAKIKCHS